MKIAAFNVNGIGAPDCPVYLPNRNPAPGCKFDYQLRWLGAQGVKKRGDIHRDTNRQL